MVVAEILPLVVVCFFAAKLVLILFGTIIIGCTDFSEDCLPQSDFEGVGASLPEFEMLGYPETKQAYYIRCPECVRRFSTPKNSSERNWAETWTEELEDAKKKLDEGEEMMNIDTKVADLNVPSNTKEFSPCTITTEAEEYSIDIERGKEIIIID